MGPSERTSIGEARTALDGFHGWRVPAGPVGVAVMPRPPADLIAGDLRLPGERTVHVLGRPRTTVMTLEAGTIRLDGGPTLSAGDVFLATLPRQSVTIHARDVRATTVTIGADLLDQVPGAAPAGFVALEGGARRWRPTAQYVERLVADGEGACASIVMASAARLVAATIASTFPATQSEPETDSRRPDAVRRAVAFVEANPAQELVLADIADAAQVGPRALQLAFRRHLGTTPMAYLRRVRLEQAHQQLADAGPGDLTVTDVAMQWRFANPSRFSQHYRFAFGEPPSHTLRR